MQFGCTLDVCPKAVQVGVHFVLRPYNFVQLLAKCQLSKWMTSIDSPELAHDKHCNTLFMCQCVNVCALLLTDTMACGSQQQKNLPTPSPAKDATANNQAYERRVCSGFGVALVASVTISCNHALPQLYMHYYVRFRPHPTLNLTCFGLTVHMWLVSIDSE